MLTALEQSHAELRAAFDAVPEAQRDQPPVPDCWSPAQVIEHLAQTAASVGVRLARGLRQLERTGLHPATDHAAVLPTLDAARKHGFLGSRRPPAITGPASA